LERLVAQDQETARRVDDEDQLAREVRIEADSVLEEPVRRVRRLRIPGVVGVELLRCGWVREVEHADAILVVRQVRTAAGHHHVVDRDPVPRLERTDGSHERGKRLVDIDDVEVRRVRLLAVQGERAVGNPPSHAFK
jgi:hypothetical protein